jgi:LysM repeat protein
MREYVVQPGDTLSRIAASELGASGMWRELADFNGLDRPDRIRVGQRLRIPGEEIASNVVNTPQAVAEPSAVPVRFHEQDKTVFAIDAAGSWERIGRRTRKGLYRIGQCKPEAFIAENTHLLTDLGLTRSEINIILATAENEGNLDAINTWDNHFLSAGIFQWTGGGANERGELPVLLAKLKNYYPDDFQHYFGRHGLDVEGTGKVTGWFSLNGQRLTSKDEKEQLRSPAWAYRFMKAGCDRQVQATQVAHAVDRIRNFYFARSNALDKVPIAKLITSEYGVALLLDNHVNRPGYVYPCVASAIQDCGLDPLSVESWSTDDEREVLAAYLKTRETYGRRPMTDARQRGEVTRFYLEKGLVSDARDSFRIGTRANS